MPIDQVERQALLKRIQAFQFDEGGEELTFAQRLARENGWSSAFTERAIEEYRRFMFLAVVAGHSVTPSDQVDQVWHLHLTYTRSYWQRWCRVVLRTDVHHGPTKGGRSEREKFHDWYVQTLDSYRLVFEADAPADLWPNSARRFGDDICFQRINTKRNWVVPKPQRVKAWTVSLFTLFCVAGIVGCASQFEEHPYATRAVLLYATLCIIVVVIVAIRFRDSTSTPRPRKGQKGGRSSAGMGCGCSIGRGNDAGDDGGDDGGCGGCGD